MDRWDEMLALHHGVLLRRDHPHLHSSLARAVAAGRLAGVLPGTFVDARLAAVVDVRIAAALQRVPEAVLCHSTAARLTFWPQLPDSPVELAGPSIRGQRPGFVFHRRAIPDERLYPHQVPRLTAPALTAIDLAPATAGESIDRVLRSRTATLWDMTAALRSTPRRIGNTDRRRLLLDSRDEPWSAAERLAHRILRGAGIRGWKANHRVRCRGHTYYLDIAFPGLKLAIEIDGRFHGLDGVVFENDRLRQNELVRSGWMVLRFTWRMLVDDPTGVIEMLRGALTIARARAARPARRSAGTAWSAAG
jgi:very-short-patch-repair endonuclease